MRSKILVSCFVTLCLVALLSAPVLALRLSPGKMGLGKGKAAKASTVNPDTFNITKSDGITAADSGDTVIYVYPFGQRWTAYGKTTSPGTNNKLIDSNAKFVDAGIQDALSKNMPVYVMKEPVWNDPTQRKTTRVISVDSNTTLTFSPEAGFILSSGDTYEVYVYSLPVYERGNPDSVCTTQYVNPVSVDERNLQWALNNIGENGTVTMKATKRGTPEIFQAFHFPGFIRYFCDGGGFQTIEMYRPCTLKGEAISGKLIDKYPELIERYSGDQAIQSLGLMTTIDFSAPYSTLWGGGWISIQGGLNPAEIRNFKVKDLIFKDGGGLGAYNVCNAEYNNVKVIDYMRIEYGYANACLFSHNHGNYFTARNCLIREKPGYQVDLYPTILLGYVSLWMGGYIEPLNMFASTNVTFENNDVVVGSSAFVSGAIGIIGNGTPADAQLRTVLVKDNTLKADVCLASMNNMANVRVEGNTGTARTFGIIACDAFERIPQKWADSARVNVKDNNVTIDSTDRKVDPDVAFVSPFTAGFSGIDYWGFPWMAFDPNFILWPITSLSNAIVENNTFTGTANYGIYMGDSYLLCGNNDAGNEVCLPNQNLGSGNVFRNNNFCGLTATSVTHLFSQTTRHNLVDGLPNCQVSVASGHPSNKFINIGTKIGGNAYGWENKEKHIISAAEKAKLQKMKSSPGFLRLLKNFPKN